MDISLGIAHSLHIINAKGVECLSGQDYTDHSVQSSMHHCQFSELLLRMTLMIIQSLTTKNFTYTWQFDDEIL